MSRFYYETCGDIDNDMKSWCESVKDFMKRLNSSSDDDKKNKNILKEIAFNYSIITRPKPIPGNARGSSDHQKKYQLVHEIIDRDGIRTLDELETILE